MGCCKTSVKGGQRVLNNGRGCSARGLPGDEVRLEEEAEHDALAKGHARRRPVVNMSSGVKDGGGEKLIYKLISKIHFQIDSKIPIFFLAPKGV